MSTPRPSVDKMDEEFGQYLRVTRAVDESEALAAAAAAWPTWYSKLYGDEIPELTVESKGWYRCQPCVCGLEHRYDVWPTEPSAKGASFTYFIGASL